MVDSSRWMLIAWAVVFGLALPCTRATAGPACPQVGFTIVEPHASSITRAVKVGKHQTLFVHRVPITTTSDIVEIRLVSELGDANADAADLLIKFTRAAERRLHEATTNHSGRRIAFMFNDEVLVNTVWEGPYGMDPGGTRVSMNHGMKQAGKLMKALRGCPGARADNRSPWAVRIAPARTR